MSLQAAFKCWSTACSPLTVDLTFESRSCDRWGKDQLDQLYGLTIKTVLGARLVPSSEYRDMAGDCLKRAHLH